MKTPYALTFKVGRKQQPLMDAERAMVSDEIVNQPQNPDAAAPSL
jgi:hypothetical protein